MKKFLFTLHLYAGLIAGIFIVILGATGAIMAFEPELDHFFYAKLWLLTPQSQRLPLTEIGAAVSKTFPGEKIAGYTISTDPSLSAQASLKRGTVFVNPYTGEILGVRAPGPTFLSNVHQLHQRLLLRDSGKVIVRWAAVTMFFLLLSGLYLWWPLKRVSIQANGPSRRFWFDVHNVVGIFSFVFLVMLTFTGLMISFDDSTVPMFYKMTGSKPSEQPKTTVNPPPGAKPITVDQAMEIARQTIPGTTPFQINVPPANGTYQVRSRFPEDLTPGGRSRVIIDQYSGQVLFAEGSRTAPAGARMVIQNRAIHTGDILGIPSKIVMSLASFMAVVQLFSGFVMWWKRPRAAKTSTPVAYENAAR